MNKNYILYQSAFFLLKAAEIVKHLDIEKEVRYAKEEIQNAKENGKEYK